jgi:orotidine-5'-phosphate decarboxylase
VKSATERIIFPLDVSEPAEAERLVKLLAGRVGMFKVGLELFARAGPGIIDRIQRLSDAGIFLDLKLCDIPATVGRTISVIASLGVQLTTIHCSESSGMLEAAATASRGRVGILAVTLLTSVASVDLLAAGSGPEADDAVTALVLQRARMAQSCGCDGVVCSGREVAAVKKHFGRSLLAVTPGIRPGWETIAADDQSRTVTPAQAIRDGADYIVVGRPIRDAPDPCRAAVRIAEEIEAVWRTP